jgi:hypothetical protein
MFIFAVANKFFPFCPRCESNRIVKSNTQIHVSITAHFQQVSILDL